VPELVSDSQNAADAAPVTSLALDEKVLRQTTSSCPQWLQKNSIFIGCCPLSYFTGNIASVFGQLPSVTTATKPHWRSSPCDEELTGIPTMSLAMPLGAVGF
jgi:hypothetical protein